MAVSLCFEVQRRPVFVDGSLTLCVCVHGQTLRVGWEQLLTAVARNINEVENQVRLGNTQFSFFTDKQKSLHPLFPVDNTHFEYSRMQNWAALESEITHQLGSDTCRGQKSIFSLRWGGGGGDLLGFFGHVGRIFSNLAAHFLKFKDHFYLRLQNGCSEIFQHRQFTDSV